MHYQENILVFYINRKSERAKNTFTFVYLKHLSSFRDYLVRQRLYLFTIISRSWLKFIQSSENKDATSQKCSLCLACD